MFDFLREASHLSPINTGTGDRGRAAMPSDALQRKPNQPHIIHSFLDDVSLTMASVATVLVCVALPLVFAYRNTMTGSNEHTARTAQNVHLRRRVQHAASGLGICLGYRWVITDASTGKREGIRAATTASGCKTLVVYWQATAIRWWLI